MHFRTDNWVDLYDYGDCTDHERLRYASAGGVRCHRFHVISSIQCFAYYRIRGPVQKLYEELVKCNVFVQAEYFESCVIRRKHIG